MSLSYPIPKGACYIWLSDAGDICLGVPPLKDSDKGHTLRFPQGKCQYDSTHTAQRGWAAIHRTLVERSQQPEATIGLPAAPTQYNIEQILKNIRAKPAVKKNLETLTLEDLFRD